MRTTTTTTITSATTLKLREYKPRDQPLANLKSIYQIKK